MTPGGSFSADVCFDRIRESKEKLLPIVHLLSLAHELNPRVKEPLTKEELGGIGLLMEDLLEDVFANVDNLEQICREVKKTA